MATENSQAGAMITEPTNSLMIRVESLEKQLRQSQRLAALVVLACPVVLLSGLATPKQPANPTEVSTSVEAGEFVLNDSQGMPCAWLKLDENDRPTLVLKKGFAHATLGLGIDGNSAGLAIGGSDGVSFIGVTPKGPNVNFRGKNLKNGLWLGVDSDLASGLHLYGETLKVGVKLRVEPDGSPSIRLADKNAKELFAAP